MDIVVINPKDSIGRGMYPLADTSSYVPMGHAVFVTEHDLLAGMEAVLALRPRVAV